jgi:hypothetical protein
MQSGSVVKRLVVVIPSRSQPSQAAFLEKAIASVRAQTAQHEVELEVLVCLDKGAAAPLSLDQRNVRFIESPCRGQAAAMNAGAAQATGDYIAFLEDDDQWHPDRVTYALRALQEAEFTSSTQLEIDASGAVARINDFATPSGWFMPMSSWHRVGPFSEAFKWHLDNEWLGRLGNSGLKRVHLVEATAPVDPRLVAQVRPWLQNVLTFGGSHGLLGRHPLLVPLVTRLIHPNSGMATIAGSPHAAAEAKSELDRIVSQFGRFPW